MYTEKQLETIANKIIDHGNKLAAKPLQWLEAEAALMVWEWFLDVELADTPNRYSQAVAYLRGEVGSSSLRILCLAYGAAIETAYQLDDNESFDCPFDWEVIPAAMRLEFDSGCTLLLESSPQEVFEALKIELEKGETVEDVKPSDWDSLDDTEAAANPIDEPETEWTVSISGWHRIAKVLEVHQERAAVVGWSELVQECGFLPEKVFCYSGDGADQRAYYTDSFESEWMTDLESIPYLPMLDSAS